MSSISSWIISIAGVCFISVVVDLVLPEGKTNSHIKNVISYVIILVVIMPIPKLLNSNFSIDDIFSDAEIQIQDDYIYNINQKKVDILTSDMTHGLEDIGIVGATISISADIFDSNFVIDAVYVDLYNVVISDNLKNTNIKTEVVSVVLNYVTIQEEKIIIYE